MFIFCIDKKKERRENSDLKANEMLSSANILTTLWGIGSKKVAGKYCLFIRLDKRELLRNLLVVLIKISLISCREKPLFFVISLIVFKSREKLDLNKWIFNNHERKNEKL